MKLKVEVIIDADREVVWRYFDDPDKLSKWQPTLESYNYVAGTPGEPDAICELHYMEKRRLRVVRESITARRAPDFLAGIRESGYSSAVVVNHFEDAGDGKTRWIAYWNYSFTGVAKFKTLFTHRSFKIRIEDDMQRFKLLVETAESGS